MKIILTIVFAGMAVASLFVSSKDPGSSPLWFGNKKLLGVVADGKHLKKWTKPAIVLISFIFFGAGILIIWFGR
jgi:hypothetical protein